MLYEKYLSASLVAIGLLRFSSALEPLTIMSIGAAAAAAGAGWFKFDFLKKHTYCRFNECCMVPYLKNDIDGLSRKLKRNLFGQHIVQDTLISALMGHLNNIESSSKPLVMYFDGTTGTGKNYVTDFIISSFYEKGINSKYVLKFAADLWITYPSHEVTSKLINNVKEKIKECKYSLFVFDETQKMPNGALDALVPLLDHHSSSLEFDYTKSIFIFLSNSAGIEIANRLKDLITHTGRLREDTKLVDFEEITELAGFNIIGALKHSPLITSKVIDYYIPFLPLEEGHAKQCIQAEFENYCPRRMTKEKINEVSKLTIKLDDTGMFQVHGCKQISKKVEAMCYT
ncbi:torsin-like protein [Wyeomyia smithii]|uniref:torsin-like protein n=1 Tax=Wyeomyia smithii TaxID=174621 RepID=UPI002467F6EF|nr:torsin-like protein [Wyeomyia smithii]